MKVFISHISEEMEIAKVLKSWIEGSFSGNCVVFVSSDGESILPGDQWLKKIETALEDTKILIILCSNASISKPWINFEAGCGWIKHVPILPICHSGISTADLPRPLSDFQGLDLSDSYFPENLLKALGTHLGFSKIPRIDASEMKIEIEGAIKQANSKIQISTTKEIAKVNSKATLDEIQIKILTYLAQDSYHSFDSKKIADQFNLHPTKCEYYLEDLDAKGHVEVSHSFGQPPEYYISKKGKAYLVEQSIL